MKAFYEFRMADVSTLHITEMDQRLAIHPDAPDMLAMSDRREWSIFTVCLNKHEDRADQYQAMHDFGFSEFFVGIIRRCAEDGISYVKFDCDGFEYEDLPRP